MRHPLIRMARAAAVAALLLTGLSAPASAGQSQTPTTNPPQAAAAAGASSEDAASARARRLLRERGIAEAGLQLASREAGSWSDSSLGCPLPGAQYTQALVSGQKLRFTGATGSYEVHVAGQLAMLCPSIAPYQKRSGRFPVRVRTLEAMREIARTDLATRLGLAAANVTVHNTAPASWANADLGCADGSTLAAGPIHGYRIVLRAQDREYIYHTDFQRVMVCPPIEAR